MKKAGVIGAILLIAVFWGDVLLDFLITTVELLLETLELITENLLEALLALTPYEAQAVTAWLGFGVFMLLLLFGFQKLSRIYRETKVNVPAWWQAQKKHIHFSWTGIGWQIALTGMLLMLVLLYI